MSSFSDWIKENFSTIDSVVARTAREYSYREVFPDVAVVLASKWYYAVTTHYIPDESKPERSRHYFHLHSSFMQKPVKRIISEIVHSKYLHSSYFAFFPLAQERHEELRQNGTVTEEHEGFYVVEQPRCFQHFVVFKGMEDRFPKFEG